MLTDQGIIDEIEKACKLISSGKREPLAKANGILRKLQSNIVGRPRLGNEILAAFTMPTLDIMRGDLAAVLIECEFDAARASETEALARVLLDIVLMAAKKRS